MAEKIEGLKQDIAELEQFEKAATRQRNKDILSIEIRKLVSEVIKLEEQLKNTPSVPVGTSNSGLNRRYEVKLNNYAWDQTDKFVKFYVTLKNIQSVPTENVSCEFTPKSLELTVKDLDGKDYGFRIKSLLYTIVPSQSTWKIKNDMIIINAAKEKLNNWSHVTEFEKKASDQKSPKMDVDNMDPTDGLMSLMKNMYETGDDEMKRTIAKAWTESQKKGPAF